MFSAHIHPICEQINFTRNYHVEQRFSQINFVRIVINLSQCLLDKCATWNVLWCCRGHRVPRNCFFKRPFTSSRFEWQRLCWRSHGNTSKVQKAQCECRDAWMTRSSKEIWNMTRVNLSSLPNGNSRFAKKVLHLHAFSLKILVIYQPARWSSKSQNFQPLSPNSRMTHFGVKLNQPFNRAVRLKVINSDMDVEVSIQPLQHLMT